MKSRVFVLKHSFAVFNHNLHNFESTPKKTNVSKIGLTVTNLLNIKKGVWRYWCRIKKIKFKKIMALICMKLKTKRTYNSQTVICELEYHYHSQKCFFGKLFLEQLKNNEVFGKVCQFLVSFIYFTHEGADFKNLKTCFTRLNVAVVV